MLHIAQYVKLFRKFGSSLGLPSLTVEKGRLLPRIGEIPRKVGEKHWIYPACRGSRMPSKGEIGTWQYFLIAGKPGIGKIALAVQSLGSWAIA